MKRQGYKRPNWLGRPPDIVRVEGRQPWRITQKDAKQIEQTNKSFGYKTRFYMKINGIYYETTGCTMKAVKEFDDKVRIKKSKYKQQEMF